MAAMRAEEFFASPSVKGLEELEQVPFWILQRGDSHLAIVRRILDELYAGGLQALPFASDVIRREGDHVAGRVSVAATHLTVRAQGEGRRSRLAEHDEPRGLVPHLEAQHVAIERQQIAQVLAPDRCSPQPLDHDGVLLFPDGVRAEPLKR